MSSELKLRRGSTAAHSTFTGADGEVTLDTDKNVVVSHDGITLGGFPHTKAVDLAASSGASLVGANAYQTQSDVNLALKTVKGFGAAVDGDTDDRPAVVLADVSGFVCFSTGTHRIATNLTIVSSCRFLPGAKIKPDAGVTVTFNGDFDAPIQQIFDLSNAGAAIAGLAKRSEIYVEWYGAPVNGVGDDSPAMEKALTTRVPTGGDIRLMPSVNYRLSGGHIIASSKCVRIVGSGESSTTVTHTGNNICFWFQAASLLGCQGSGISDMKTVGPATGTSAKLVRLSDAWGMGAKRVLSYGYNQGEFSELYNYLSWTEGAVFEDVMIRDALVGFNFTRSGSGTDTNSFYGFTASRVQMELNGGNNRFLVCGYQASLPKIIYGVNLDRCATWLGATGGGKRSVYIGNTNSLIGKCHLITDGTGGITDGSDLNLFYVEDGGVIDLQGLVDTRQGTPGNALSVLQIMKQQTVSNQNNRRPNVRIKGAQIQLNGTATAGQANHIGWSSGYCPPFSSFRVRLSFAGWNTEGTSEWIVSNYNVNHYPNLTRIHGPGTATELVYVRSLSGGTPGSFSSNNGLRFEIYLASSVSANAIQWTADVEML